MQKIEASIVDEYIKNFPEDIQIRMRKLRKLIKDTIPGAVESISYKMPAYKINGKTLIYFAGYKNHIGFYPFPSGIEAFKKETSEYKTSKGAIQFPNNKPIPHDLVKRIVEFRVKESMK
ncbi:MAG: hypothetical protein UT34_C0002G0314 [candidate division WS6 bacterium GW2011_GWF2_39_15]|uniref:YdhG-like domain-containing protein n=1 Tax=candidate division WS6 bacterium GW2011_GWF2_39_15 TaxID=1619100 RepID=A0A0G0QW06_9BACT|nr:MAG: hypothetical protein UT34_C0002G0314 [candidate division WS6 bacterium GW2011_GWF2_39_15]